jgi:hypothetical protein
MSSEPSKPALRPPMTQRQAAALCEQFRLDGPNDLPPPGTPIRLMEGKAQVVAAVLNGLIEAETVYDRYRLSPLEFRVWRRLVEHSSYIPA